MKILKGDKEFMIVGLLITLASLSAIVVTIFSYFTQDMILTEFIMVWVNYFLNNSFWTIVICSSTVMVYVIGFFITIIFIKKSEVFNSLMWPITLGILSIDKCFNLCVYLTCVFISNDDI